MSNKEFKVGDIVMAIDDYYGITSKKNKWTGKVTFVYDDGDIDVERLNCIEDYGCKTFVVDPEHFELIAEDSSIHISIDGNKVIAVMKKNGKVVNRAEAKCSPNDEFNFETGAKLAFVRLLEKKPEFIPHLECTWLGKTTNYGEIGKPTNYKDSNGEPLFIGDTVSLESKTMTFSNIPVVEYKGHQFIMGIRDCFAEDNSKMIKDEWTIVKTKSSKDFKHNDKTICILSTFCYKLKEE